MLMSLSGPASTPAVAQQRGEIFRWPADRDLHALHFADRRQQPDAVNRT